MYSAPHQRSGRHHQATSGFVEKKSVMPFNIGRTARVSFLLWVPITIGHQGRSFTTENTMYGIENFEDSLESFDEGTDLTDNVFDSVQRIISDNLLVSE